MLFPTGAQADPQEGPQGVLQGYPPPGSQAGTPKIAKRSRQKVIRMTKIFHFNCFILFSHFRLPAKSARMFPDRNART